MLCVTTGIPKEPIFSDNLIKNFPGAFFIENVFSYIKNKSKIKNQFEYNNNRSYLLGYGKNPYIVTAISDFKNNNIRKNFLAIIILFLLIPVFFTEVKYIVRSPAGVVAFLILMSSLFFPSFYEVIFREYLPLTHFTMVVMMIFAITYFVISFILSVYRSIILYHKIDWKMLHKKEYIHELFSDRKSSSFVKKRIIIFLEKNVTRPKGSWPDLSIFNVEYRRATDLRLARLEHKWRELN